MNVFVRRSPGLSANIPAEFRFQVVLGGEAVLDRETNLVWQRRPAAAPMTLLGAASECLEATTGGKRGWRLPSIYELSTLADEGQTSAPPLPTGHPFDLGASAAFFWSATRWPPEYYVIGDFSVKKLRAVLSYDVDSHRRWCVRAAEGLGQ